MGVTNYLSRNGQLMGESGPNGTMYYHTDALGSVVMTTDENSNVLNTYRYKPFGGLLAKSGTAPDPKYLWVGSLGYRSTGQLHAEYYVRNRHYGMTDGRWTTVDPLWPDQLPFGYVRNSPASSVDPSGLLPYKCPPCSALIAANSNADGVAALLNCINKNGGSSGGLQECITSFGGDIAQATWQALAPYLACMEASETALGKKGCNACLSAGSDAQNCCFQQYLTNIFNCVAKNGTGQYIFCVLGADKTFKKCAALGAFKDDKPF